MELDIVHLWESMNGLVRGVVIVLTIQALLCLMVVVDRLILLFSSGRKAKAFAKGAGKHLSKNDLEGAVKLAKEYEGNPLASMIETGLKTFLDRTREGMGREKAAEHTRRALERRGEQLSESLHRGMNILASTGSTAPFVGLLGTVLGILNAFKLISDEGGGGIGTIGAAIGEALIVTGYGLMVAIPSVLLFNYLSGKIAKYESGLGNAASELVDSLEADSFARAEATADAAESATEKAGDSVVVPKMTAA